MQVVATSHQSIISLYVASSIQHSRVSSRAGPVDLAVILVEFDLVLIKDAPITFFCPYPSPIFSNDDKLSFLIFLHMNKHNQLGLDFSSIAFQNKLDCLLLSMFCFSLLFCLFYKWKNTVSMYQAIQTIIKK